MAFLDDQERADLRILQMIFHIVGPSVDDATILSPFERPIFEDFFLARIRSALGGNRFSFKDTSRTQAVLRSVLEDQTRFVDVSARLARNFQEHHRGQSSNGVFFLFLLETRGRRLLFALVKYDDDQVVRYQLEAAAAGRPPRAILEELHQTFVKKSEALQKLALVSLDENPGQLLVKDRSRPHGISDYFDRFLSVRRSEEPRQLTGRFHKVLKSALRAHKHELPPEVVRDANRRIAETLRNTEVCGPDTHEQIFAAVFGGQEQTAPVRRTYRRLLSQERIEEETFQLVPTAIPVPRRKRIETVEGFQITFDREYEDRIRERPRDDGGTDIVITTDRVTVRDDDPEDGRRGDRGQRDGA